LQLRNIENLNEISWRRPLEDCSPRRNKR